MKNSKTSAAAFAAAVLLALLPGIATADELRWNDAMKAAERASNESRYADAEQFLRTAVKEAEEFAPGDRRIELSLSFLATILFSRGKDAEAEQTFLQAVAILEKNLPARKKTDR